MSDFPSWSDDRDSYSNASWSNGGGPPAPPPSYGGAPGYPGADSFPPRDGYRFGGSFPPGPPPPRDGFSGSYDRPRFSEDGVGQPFSGGAAPAAGGKANDISYDTSSRDPALLRSRVFIGSIGRGPIVREDVIELCRPFGALIACTLFKGYAFIQFAQAADADTACEALNGKRWKGVNIDVHLAMEGLVRKTLPQKRPAESGPKGGSGKGGGTPISSSNAIGTKRPRANNTGAEDDYDVSSWKEVNEQNRRNADADTSVPQLVASEMADTLICGTCRYVTSDFIAFREHRKRACTKPKDGLEPPVLKCASCGLRFLTAWKMLFHLTDFHRMQLFKPDYAPDSVEKAKVEDERYRKIQEERMSMYKAEQIKRSEQQPFDIPEDEREVTRSPLNGDNRPSTNPPVTSSTSNQQFTDDAVENTFEAAPKAPPATSEPVEKVTTGADYDEDEEDEETTQPSAIPTLG